MHGEPFRYGLGRRGESAAFAHPEQKPAYGEHSEARRESVTGARQAPPDHDRDEAAPRPEYVHQLATARVHERIRQQKRRLQPRVLRIGNWDIALDRGDRDGQRLPVEVADGDRAGDQDGDGPPILHSPQIIC